MTPDSRLSEADLLEIQKRFPFFEAEPFPPNEEPRSAYSLFTVNTIVRYVEYVLAQDDSRGDINRSVTRDPAADIL